MPWGWIEWFIIVQTFLPGLLFIPGLSSVPAFRTLTRVASYLIAVVAWVRIRQRDQSNPGASTFAARPWLILCSLWLVINACAPE